MDKMMPIYFAPTRKLGGGWVCHKDSPSQPQAPDPTATAAAQTASNVATANANATLNRVNQNTPWGSSTYTAGTPDANGTAQWTQNVTLSPAQQALLDSQNRISQSLANTGESQLANVNSALSNPINYNSMTAVNNTPAVSHLNGDYGTVQNAIPTGDLKLVGSAGYGNIQDDVRTDNLNALKTSVDRTGVTPLVGGDALGKAMTDAQQASYNQQQSRLDPQYQQQQRELENKLTQQGVMEGSNAWNSVTGQFGRDKTDAYQTAYNNSVGLGNAAQQQLFTQGLQANQNAFGQNTTDANLNNSANQQQFGQNLAAQQAHNAAQGQGFGQSLSNAQLANSTAQQVFDARSTNALLNNNAQNQLFSQAGQQAQLNNQASSQNFNQSTAARNQQIAEANQAQQQPLNILNALRTGAQVSSPQFNAAPQANVAGTNTAQIAQNDYNNQLGLYNSQVGSNNQLTSGLFSLGGSAILA